MLTVDTRVHFLEPPYQLFGGTAAVPAAPALRRGTVVALRPAATDSSETIQDAILTTRRTFLRAPLVLWADRMPAQNVARLAMHGHALGVAGFVHESEFGIHDLWMLLERNDTLAISIFSGHRHDREGVRLGILASGSDLRRFGVRYVPTFLVVGPDGHRLLVSVTAPRRDERERIARLTAR